MAMETITKGDLVSLLSERLKDEGLNKTQVRAVLTALEVEVADCIKEGYAINLSGLVKLDLAYREAKPRRKGINPFDREAGEVWLKAKPASLVVKAKPLGIVKKAVPSPKSKAGQQIIASLNSK